MPDEYKLAEESEHTGRGTMSGGNSGIGSGIVIQNYVQTTGFLGRWLFRLFVLFLICSTGYLYLKYVVLSEAPPANQIFVSGQEDADETIAVIKVGGVISGSSVDRPIHELKMATEDEKIKAIILEINSPGGTVSASDKLYYEIERFKKETKKPIVVSMHGLGASGAYYISLPADKIFADKSCITGSIGVIMSSLNFADAMEKIGVAPDVIKSGEMKDSGTPYRKRTEQEQIELQALVDEMFSQFVTEVVKHRSDSLGGDQAEQTVRDFEARIYLAPQAKEKGIIDAVGTFDDAVQEAKKLAGLSNKDVRVFRYERPFGGWEQLIQLKTDEEDPIATAKWGNLSITLNQQAILEFQQPQFLMMPATFCR